MANTKDYSIREMILDRRLSDGNMYTIGELMDYCNAELDLRGENLVTSRTTIHYDLDEISNKYKVVIDSVKRGRQVYYRYHDSGFSIYRQELSEDDYNQLAQTIAILKRFRGMPQFEWIEELDARFTMSFRHGNDSPVVGFDDNPFNKGMEHFSPLFRAITQKQVLRLTYKSFHQSEPIVRIIHPYYLKEYNNRWFLFCLDDKHGNISVYALDRIISIERIALKYIPCEEDWTEYFEDIIGVSDKEGKPEKIQLWFSAEQLPYIETKPLHGSQKILSRDASGAIVQIEVVLNYELEQLLLSFGEKVKVLSPDDFREKIKERIRKSLENY
jgi:predicted DNA-binding transcriptional regulator YafY